MSDQIPQTDATSPSSKNNDDGKSSEPELRILEAEAKLKKQTYLENVQRYWIKWIAVFTGLFVILGMAFALWYFVCIITSPESPSTTNAAFTVAMIVAPVASMTVITVALFVGAFRKFEKEDPENMGSGIARGANMLRSDI